jgi:hypothetical protein
MENQTKMSAFKHTQDNLADGSQIHLVQEHGGREDAVIGKPLVQPIAL